MQLFGEGWNLQGYQKETNALRFQFVCSLGKRTTLQMYMKKYNYPRIKTWKNLALMRKNNIRNS